MKISVNSFAFWLQHAVTFILPRYLAVFALPHSSFTRFTRFGSLSIYPSGLCLFAAAAATPPAASVGEMTERTVTDIQARLQETLAFHKRGNYAEAIVGYNEVVPYLTGSTKLSILGNLGALYMQTSRFDEALSTFELAVETSPTNSQAHFNIAVLLTSKFNEHKKAMTHCLKAMKADPSNYKAVHLLGNILQSIGRPEDADRYFVMAENLAREAEATASPTGVTTPATTSSSSDTAPGPRWTVDFIPIVSKNTEVGGTSIVALPDGSSYTVTCLSKQPLLFYVSDVITAEECKHMVERASEHQFEESFVMGGGDVDAAGSDAGSRTEAYRSSSTVWLSNDDVLNGIKAKIAGIMGIPLPFITQKSEELQVVRYLSQQQFKVHQDSSAFHPRLFTALMYVKSPEEGGDTWFPYAAGEDLPETVDDAIKLALERSTSGHTGGLKVNPKQGGVVIFFNHVDSTGVDVAAVHAGLPVISGTKWIANYWVECDIDLLQSYMKS